MILIFCFNNFFEVLKKFFWCNWGYVKYQDIIISCKYIIMAGISKALKWNLIKQFINL